MSGIRRCSFAIRW